MTKPKMIFRMMILTGFMQAALMGSLVAADSTTQDLSGTWRFEIDQKDQGEKAAWFSKSLKKTIKLPGSMSENGYGNPGELGPGKLGVGRWGGWRDNPIWHPILKKDYRGSAWYQRDITIPAQWKNHHIQLLLERVCWVSEVWVDDQKIGRQEYLSAPHQYEIGTLKPGPHQLTIKVDNRQLHYLGCNTHGYHEQSLTIFNGIVGRIELSARPKVFIRQSRIFSDPDTGNCVYDLKIDNVSGKEAVCTLAGRIADVSGQKKITVPTGISQASLTLTIPPKKVKRWGEFEQPLYTAKIKLKSSHGTDRQTTRFGFRRFETRGKQFLLNGKVVLMRGEASNNMFPLTGYAPMDVESWRKVFQLLKDFGLNHYRCHSFTPPQAAFAAADELGIFIQPELPHGETTGGNEVEQAWREKEFFGILDSYGNHPSFMLYSNGNEAKTTNVEFFNELVRKGKKYDNRHLYTMMSNPEASRKGDGFEDDQFLVSHSAGGNRRRLERSLNRTKPNTAKDYRNTMPRDIPYICHETGQWSVYPPIRTIDKYTGVVEPRNLIEFKKRLNDAGMLAQADEFEMASGQLSLLLYKEEIEHSLRTPEYGGFQLLGLQDSYDHGSAFVGHVDNLFEPKPYVTAQQFRRFCGPVVPLARMSQRVWRNTDTFKADIEIAQYGAGPLNGKTVSWTLTRGDQTINKGTFSPQDLPATGLLSVGQVKCSLEKVKQASKLLLTVSIEDTEYSNDWDLWVYPKELEMPKNDEVLVVDRLTPEIGEKLKKGASVVLLPNHYSSPYRTAMTTPFWSPLLFANQRQTLGFTCNPAHPALKYFPTDSYQNWQWREMVFNGAAMDLSSVPGDYRPIVQAIDHAHRCHRLGLIYEGRVGKGKLLVCTLDVNYALHNRPVARQLRYSLLKYAASDAFAPKVPIDIKNLFKIDMAVSTLVTEQLVEKILTDSEHENQWSNNAVDGNPRTFWHTRWDDTATPHPHFLTVELKKSVPLKGILYTPRQGHSHGRIKDYKVYISKDGSKWTEVASGKWPNSSPPQKVMFKSKHTARFIKLESLSDSHNKGWACVAELDIIQ